MESSQIPHPQIIGQSSFYYYNPEPNNDNRQHGHFSAHPSASQKMHQYQQQGYSFETSMPGQQPIMYSHVPSAVPSMYIHQNSMLAMATPRPIQQKPTFLYQPESQQLSVDTECTTPDVYIYPSTPPLSASGSASSSPPSTCGVLPTPITGSYMGFGIEGVKEGCAGDVQSEILAGGDWTRSMSPPLTPGMSSKYYEIGDSLACKQVWRSPGFWQNFFGVVNLIICGVRSVHPPTFGYGEPSLRPPIHQLLSLSFSLTVACTTIESF